MSWACPRCDRTFRRVNQRHACGVGSAATLLKSRPPALIDFYQKLETKAVALLQNFGSIPQLACASVQELLPFVSRANAVRVVSALRLAAVA
jgi:hypothetical protein